MTVKRGTSGINLTTLTGVTLKGMPASATVDLNTLMSASTDNEIKDALGITGTTDIVAYIQSKTPTQAVVEAIVAPHTIAKGKSIDFTIGRETKTYTFDAPLTLAPGKVYDFVFTLNTKSFDGMTNCYMVAPGETLNFKVSRAYTYNATTKTFNDALHVGGNYNGTNDKFDVDIVWADCAGLFSSLTVDDVAGHQATVTVQANTTNKVGNAVVALKKKGTGNIVWSYHIWVTKYKPDDDAAQDNAVYEHKGNTNNNGYYFIFMDRNLGASFAGKNNTASSMGTGLYYQWGRKDPFPDTDGTLAVGSFSRVQTTDILGTIPNTIKNPNVFYYNTSSAQYYDWHQPIRIDTLWDHSNNQKTIYDPCPSGWRVPRYTGTAATDSPWYGFTISGKTFSYGYVFDTNAIYPAPGLRPSRNSSDFGKLGDVGKGGYVYSATTGTTPLRLAIESGVVYFGATDSRSHGFSVRCVRE
jgi:hypothetical protein